MEALALSNSRDAEFAAAFSLAVSGDLAATRTLISDLEGRFPEDTSVQFCYLPASRGALLLAQGRPADAIGALEESRPWDRVVPVITFSSYFSSLYPTYVRGQALLAMNRGEEAVTEFQKILTHRGLVLADPLGAVARLQLARAFAMSGQRPKARIAYEDFLSLWKDADSDIPILRDAKSEYSKLR